MRFGPVPSPQAEGAILAHSLAAGPKRLRKGKTLTPEDIAQLVAHGVHQVTVARLDSADIDENTAAACLAKHMQGQNGIRVTEAFTGRCNLVATHSGVVRVDADKINAFNAIDPMITIATVPDYHIVDSTRLLATIKVISFAVPRVAVERAAAVLKDAITLHGAELRTASLIVTQLDQNDGDKGIEAVKARTERFGVDLGEVLTVPHAAPDIAKAISAAAGDVILILTASATSDVNDTAPQALRHAGGQIERFGMPVDPGNLLFIGAFQGRPVIGLPGCARSPALNGADWVLSRVLCGLPVTASDIAGMGVGGLLKEIPTRPQPRRAK